MEGDRDTDRLSENAIVGAGIAGTALAIALKQSGLSVRLYDRPEVAPQPGAPQPAAPLFISANGTRVLHALGLKDELAGIALTPQFATLRHGRTGFLLSQRPLGAFSEARYGAPDVLVDGARLVELLRQTAQALDIPLAQTSPVQDVDAGSSTLTLANGERIQHQSVAVAAGTPVDSQAPGITNLLNERTWSQPADHIAIRAVGLRADPVRDHDRFINTWVADGIVIIEEPLDPDGEDQPVSLTVISPADEVANADAPATELMSQLTQRSHQHLRTLLKAPRVERITEPVAEIADYWFAEKLVLLGGACHAHAGFPALTASAALEDAWVLSRMMERWEESPHQGFPEYERYRKPRARRLRTFSEAERAALGERSAMAAWQRNLKWSLTSRFLPEITMQRTDWVYGYDCIRGFA